MSQQILLQLGTGGLLALLIIREVLGFLKARSCKPPEELIRKIAIQVRDLHDWHNKTDEDGVKVWYVRRSLEDAIVKLSSNIEVQSELLRELVYDLRETRRDVKDIQKHNSKG